MKEIWKDIKRYERLYQVSNYGIIRRIKNRYDNICNKIIKPGKNKKGYLQVCLCKNREKETYPIHKLVLETFIGPCPPGMQCRHLDGNKLNNKLDNLKWGTPKENKQDSIEHGTYKCPPLYMGSEQWKTKFVDKDILEIIILIKNNFSDKDISLKYNINKKVINDIRNKKHGNI